MLVRATNSTILYQLFKTQLPSSYNELTRGGELEGAANDGPLQNVTSKDEAVCAPAQKIQKYLIKEIFTVFPTVLRCVGLYSSKVTAFRFYLVRH